MPKIEPTPGYKVWAFWAIYMCWLATAALVDGNVVTTTSYVVLAVALLYRGARERLALPPSER